MSSEGSTPEDYEHSVTTEIRERFNGKEPSSEQKDELLNEHDGHLVRRTTSKLSVDAAADLEGIEVDASIHVPDMFCFTCGEWVGLSGVGLRGTPRSKTDAYYLGGVPDDVSKAKGGVEKTLNKLSDALCDRVDHLNSRSEAYDFIQTELDSLQADSE